MLTQLHCTDKWAALGHDNTNHWLVHFVDALVINVEICFTVIVFANITC